MGKWIKDIDQHDFLKWATENPEQFSDLFPEILPVLEEAESMDFFGTEGFDNRFGG